MSLNSFFSDSYSSVDEMPVYKQWIGKVANVIDNGTFFREPMVWFYRALGILWILLYLAAFVYAMLDFKYISRTFGAVNVIAGLVILAAIAFFALLFWVNRSNKLRHRVATGSDTVVIPIIADITQSSLELTGLILMIFGPIFLLYMGIIGQWFMSGYATGTDHIIFILIGIFGCIPYIIIGYFTTVWGHFCGENLRAIATVVNNIRDLGDIHRAATMPKGNEQENVQ